MYANSLVEVGKLIYLIGNNNQTSQLKKVLEATQIKGKILYKCYEDIPGSTFKKIKHQNVREGTIRSDWINKIIDRYPQMVIFIFNCGEELSGAVDVEKLEVMLRAVLKKINLFYANHLKPNNKQDIVVRIIMTVTKQQMATQQVQAKINDYLKPYQKDVFIMQGELMSRQISKYRTTWLGYLQKGYQKKNKKLIKKLQQSNTIQKRICYSFKAAVVSQILNREQRNQYINSYNIIKYQFSEITKRQFNFLKFLEIRQLRVIADTLMLRYIKFKIGSIKEIPEFVTGHLNFFKMRSMDPSSCHFYYYYEELLWRSTLIDNLLEVFYASQINQLLPQVTLAELINGLLSYLHKLANLDASVLNQIAGKVVTFNSEIYLGKINYGEMSDGDLVMSGMTFLVEHKKDFITRGIQIISRYKNIGLFRENEINLLNIYLIRFYLAEGKFVSIINIYHEIIKLELQRCNYFLINQLFHQIQNQIPKLDHHSKMLLYGVASIISDYFENKQQLSKLIQQFYQMIKEQNFQISNQSQSNSLFDKSFAPQAIIFKLKKSSSIFTARIIINQQIILSQSHLRIKLRFKLHDQLRKRMNSSESRIQLSFNIHNMVIDMPIGLDSKDGQWIQRQFIVQPLQHIRKDAILKIQSVQLMMQNKNLIWVIQRNQIVFEKFDSTLLYCKIQQPQVIIEKLNKLYYINEAAYFNIIIKGITGCRVTSRLLVNQENQGNTQFFINIKDKKDLTNSKLPLELQVDQGLLSKGNICWIKCNKLGNKTLKLQFNHTVQKTINVRWRDKPLCLRCQYAATKELNFTVSNLFNITKIFRQAVTGNLLDNHIPLNKKTLLTFYIKSNENIFIKEVDIHSNPRKIKYLKMIKMNNFNLAPKQNLKANLLFQLDQQCQNQIQLFLATLIIKWKRIGSNNTIQNIFLDQQIKVNSINDKIAVTLQQPRDIQKRKKTYLSINICNLMKQTAAVKAVMQSTQNLMRIGDKSKILLLDAGQKGCINFDILAIHSGIFDFPGIKIYVNDTQIKISTQNFLVYCR